MDQDVKEPKADLPLCFAPINGNKSGLTGGIGCVLVIKKTKKI